MLNTSNSVCDKQRGGGLRASSQQEQMQEFKSMKEMLAEQRKALRDFSSYYRIKGGNN